MLSRDPIFRIHAELAEIRHFGRTPHGERRVVDITGGQVDGPRLRGRVLPGADWQLVRPDGVTEIQARYGIETEAGARIVVTSEGLRHGPADVMQRLATGEAIDPSLYYFRTALRFETADSTLDWLNRILAVGHGARRARAVEIDVYEVM
jgi:hypothetical protein